VNHGARNLDDLLLAERQRPYSPVECQMLAEALEHRRSRVALRRTINRAP